jgi:hypothetical protein
MQQSGDAVTQRVVALVEVFAMLNLMESKLDQWHATGAQPGPSFDRMEAALNVSKDIYMQQMRALSQEELRALGNFIN